MKRTGLSVLTKNAFLSIMMTMTVFLFTSCAHKISFLTSSVVPAARGGVKIKKDKNKNSVIQIHLSNLAEANRLTPPRKTYVVWMQTSEERTENIGQIKSLKNLNASFETTSSSYPIKIFITAEDDASIQYPSTQMVLTTNRF